MRPRRFSPWLLLAAFGLGTWSARSQSVTLVNAFPRLTFTEPVFLTHAGDGTNRVFVVQQTGQIIVLPNDSATASSKIFLDISAKLSAPSGEEGLLGLAFHPNYPVNGYFYVNYTAPNPLRTVVSRFRVQQNNANRADSLSEFVILEISQPFTNHNGGMVSFGPDGYLYIGMGDGGSGDDPQGNGQNRGTLLGKMLRLDVNDTTTTRHYKIPADNPYVGNSQGWREEIWAYGFRNPWRWSFDTTGVLWVGDVGQSAREEVDIVVKGGNYGWKIMEGSICRPGGPPCDTTGLLKPIKEYDHNVGNAITGGYVYRGYRRPSLIGAYIYADYGTGKIWMLRSTGGVLTADSLLIDTSFLVSSFGVDQARELYIVSYGTASSIYRFTGNPLPAGVDVRDLQPAAFLLDQNYPNPFNPSTVISYVLPTVSAVRLVVFDVLGREIAVLVNALQQPGRYTKTWTADDISSGIYFCRLTCAAGTATRKMVLSR